MKKYDCHKYEKKKETIMWILCSCSLVGILLFINSNLLTIAVVSGDSMYPSLRNGEYLLVDRMYDAPSYGDIIVVQDASEEHHSTYIVKRVIAIGGDTVTVNYDKNKVFVNGKLFDEPYLNYEVDDPMRSADSMTSISYHVPIDSVFLMGDNRNFSLDSRSEEIGFVLEKNIVGKVLN